jgi:alcohol dehydrogenase class IV
VIVRWGLGELDGLLGEIGSERPLLVTTPRGRGLVPPRGPVFEGVRPHVPAENVDAAEAAAAGTDGLLALGGGSAIDKIGRAHV